MSQIIMATARNHNILEVTVTARIFGNTDPRRVMCVVSNYTTKRRQQQPKPIAKWTVNDRQLCRGSP